MHKYTIQDDKVKALCTRCEHHLLIENKIVFDGEDNLKCPKCNSKLAFFDLTNDAILDCLNKRKTSHPRTKASEVKVEKRIKKLNRIYKFKSWWHAI